MTIQILEGDCRAVLATLPANSVHCCITSPPYWGLRDYGVDGMIGLEESFQDWLTAMVETFREVRRVLRDDGTLFLNLGDAYAGSPNGRSADETKALGIDNRTFRDRPVNTAGAGFKPKDLMMQPVRVAIALQADGWYLRAMMPWLKRNPMPDSATDRPGVSTEYVFMLAKSKRYFWDGEAVKRTGAEPDRQRNDRIGGANGHLVRHSEGGMMGQSATRNFRAGDLFYSSLSEPYGLITDSEGNPLALDVNTAGFSDAHFATFPLRLIEPLVKAGTSEKGVCAECGAPWVREVEAEIRHTQKTHNSTDVLGFNQAANRARDGHVAGQMQSKTVGWSPSCQCNAPTAPATVLDCFGGAGTTALVADRLGRNATLIELNPDYAQMARERLIGDAGMFAQVT